MFCEVFNLCYVRFLTRQTRAPCVVARFARGGVLGWGVSFIISVTEMIWATGRSNHLTLSPSLDTEHRLEIDNTDNK